MQATVFYLIAYTVMNLAAFAVIVARERETGLGDDISALYGLGADRPLLAWPMTIAMLALAGFPATAGFFGKVYLIEATVENDYGWLGVAIVIGSAISLAYYLRVVAAVWMRSPSEAVALRPGRVPGGRPAIAGGSQEADAELVAAPPRHRQPELVFVAVVCALATVFLGVYPEPVFEVARDAGAALTLARLGGEFSRGAAYGWCVVRPPSTPRSSGSWVPRWPAPGRSSGWRRSARRWRAGCGPASASWPATCAGRPTPRRRGWRRARWPSSTRGEGLTFTVASIRFGADDAWTAVAALRRHRDRHPRRRAHGWAAKVGIGVEASPLGVERRRRAASSTTRSGRPGVGVPGRRVGARASSTTEDREDHVEPTWRFGDVGRRGRRRGGGGRSAA